MIKYIHYGHSKFAPLLFKPVQNQLCLPKPTGGFWASRTDSDSGWAEWCGNNDFHLEKLEEKFIFTLKPESKILVIKSCEEVDKLKKVYPLSQDTFPTGSNIGILGWTYLDYEKIAADYDAIEFFISWGLYQKLYGWDCDSLLVLNPDVIIAENLI